MSEKLYLGILYPNSRKWAKCRRPLAMVLAILAVLGVIGLAGGVIVPGIRDAVLTIADQLPDAIARLEKWAIQVQEYLPQIEAFIIDLNVDWEGISRKIMTLAQDWGTHILSSGSDIIGSVVSAVVTFFMASKLRSRHRF